jgi:N-acetylmuramoyl-L-alanine amidase
LLRQHLGQAGLALTCLLVCLLVVACAPLPVGPPDRPITIPSPNHDERRPNVVVIHETTNDQAEVALKTLTDPARKVSAHYLIGRDGTLYQLVDERRRAWHAGVSYWGGNTDLNSASIGIELDNNGAEAFAEAQIVRLIDLLKDLQARYSIPRANFIGHGDIAVRRKVDPSRFFPWQRLAQEGFGLWCRQPHVLSLPPQDPSLALQAIGYDVTNQQAALAAFRRHFLGVDTEGDATDADLRLLQCLVQELRLSGTALQPPIVESGFRY